MTEVVCDLSFAAIPDFGASGAGWWRDAVAESYKHHEIHPPLPPLLHPAVAANMGPGPGFLLDASGGSAVRTWNVSEDGQRVVQLQHDRLILNWRRLQEGATYPRFSQIGTEFAELTSLLARIADEKTGSRVRASRIEVVYQNMIDAYPGIWSDFSEVGKVFPWIQWPRELGDPSSLQFSAEMPITREQGAHAAMSIQVSPARNNETGTPAISLRLASTEWLSDDSLETAMAAAGAAHEQIVRLFPEITSPDMQREAWARKEDGTDGSNPHNG